MAANNLDFTAQPSITEDTGTGNHTFSAVEIIRDSDYPLLENFQYVNISVRLLIGLLALNCNLLTVVAIGRYEYLHTCTNYLIAALAFADIIGGFNCVLVFINYLTPMTDETWLNMCAAEHTLSQISAGLNLAYILWISVDRFVFITFPLRYYSLVTPRLIFGAVLLSFLVVLIQAITMNLAIEEYRQPLGNICRGIFPGLAKLAIDMWFYVTTPVIVLLYTRIAWIAYRQSRAIEQTQNMPLASQQHKITKMLSLVLGVFMLCYIPQFTMFAMKQYLTPEIYVILERASSWFWWINSCINPFIYAWKNKHFNKAFRSLLRLPDPTINPMHDSQLT